jgi:translocation and assembly module TamA
MTSFVSNAPARCILMVLACATLALPAANAANPQSYKVDWLPSGDKVMDSVMKATSQLETLRTTAPVDPYGLIARARGDVSRLQTVLNSFGYYRGTVTVTINGMGLADPNLGDALAALPKGTDARVRIAPAPGVLFHIGHIEIEGRLPAGTAGKLGLSPGTAAVAADIAAASGRLQAALQDDGYAFAKVEPPVAYELPAQQLLNLTYRVAAGPRVRIGPIRIEGLKRVHERLVRRRLLVRSGALYDASAIEKARQDLLTLGIFSTVSVRLGSAPDLEGRLPVTFVVAESKLYTAGVSGAYSSDLGGSAGVNWADHDVLGNGELLSFTATAIDLGGTASTGIGYDTKLSYAIPDFYHRDQELQFSVGAIRQTLQAYTQTGETAGTDLSRKLSSVWTVTAGLSYEHEIIEQEGIGYKYNLFSVPLTALYDSTDLASPLLDPTHGYKMSFDVAPTFSYGTSGQTFLVTQASLATYFDLSKLFAALGPGRSVLAAKIMAGVDGGATQFSLPPDQRFYAGGSGTVRGYRYQSVGPEFRDGNPEGGTSMQALNLELRQRVGTNLGFVVFADGGGVTSSAGSLYRVGVGTGMRYYTSIGPIRFDVAVPTTRRPNDDKFEVYIGLGQAF